MVEYQENDTIMWRAQVLRRWNMSRHKADGILRANGVEPIWFGYRQGFKLSDILRIEKELTGKAPPLTTTNIRRARKAVDDARAAA